MDRRDRHRKGAVFQTNAAITLQELCRAYGLERSLVVSMVEHGIIDFRRGEVFDAEAMTRLNKAARLYKDLQVNVQGIAVILDLLDELEAMRARVAALERTFKER